MSTIRAMLAPLARPAPARLREVLGVHVLQELPELLHLMLLVVADHDGGLGEDVLVREDGNVDPDREGDGVGGPRRDLVALAVLLHGDLGLVRTRLEPGSTLLPHAAPWSSDHVPPS